MSSQKFTHEQLLDRLGEVAVRVGLNLVPQQQLFITAPLESVPLVRRITEHAYKAGASLVTTFFSDDEITLARYRYASAESFDIANGWVADAMAQAYREGTARLAVTGGNPTLLKGQNPDYISRASKASSKVNRPAMEVITQFATNWTIVAAANPVWAKQVFPDLSEPEALEALWQGIFKASRVDHDDPVSVWQEHNRHLHERSARLNDLRFDALAFKGPGTDITIGLADGHFWAGGRKRQLIILCVIPISRLKKFLRLRIVPGLMVLFPARNHFFTKAHLLTVFMCVFRKARLSKFMLMPGKMFWNACWIVTKAHAALERSPLCLIPRLFHKVAFSIVIHFSTKMPQAILLSASHTPNA